MRLKFLWVFKEITKLLDKRHLIFRHLPTHKAYLDRALIIALPSTYGPTVSRNGRHCSNGINACLLQGCDAPTGSPAGSALAPRSDTTANQLRIMIPLERVSVQSTLKTKGSFSLLWNLRHSCPAAVSH